MALGKIIEFDPVEGCGFIAPDGGGPRVSVHGDDLGGQWDVSIGTPVRYSSIQGAQGPKAYNVGILTLPSGNQGRLRASLGDRTGGAATDADGDDFLGVQLLSHREYAEEVTDILISLLPGVTATEIVEVRSQLVRRAAGHGWLAW
jgi:CspA family cold shock protein